MPAALAISPRISGLARWSLTWVEGNCESVNCEWRFAGERVLSGLEKVLPPTRNCSWNWKKPGKPNIKPKTGKSFEWGFVAVPGVSNIRLRQGYDGQAGKHLSSPLRRWVQPSPSQSNHSEPMKKAEGGMKKSRFRYRMGQGKQQVKLGSEPPYVGRYGQSESNPVQVSRTQSHPVQPLFWVAGSGDGWEPAYFCRMR